MNDRSVLFSAAYFIVLLLGYPPAYAWDDHAIITSIALSSLEKLQGAPQVKVETLDAFLVAEKDQLAELLDNEEEWARKNIFGYLPRPDAIKFKNSENLKDLRSSFLQAIRTNPKTPLSLFLQQIPGLPSYPREAVSADKVTLLPKSLDPEANRFIMLRNNEYVAPIQVVTTASSEPDFDLDIHLWENNHSNFSANYGFGNQPFGNPTLEFASQAPFHMTFLHESGIVYRFAPYLKMNLPEYRVHLYSRLGKYAFEQGHPYWGWRFTGWALHYIQDLTQPYHSTALPGLSVAKMLFINLMDFFGFHSWKTEAIQLVTNRHLALEKYQLSFLLNCLENNDTANVVIQSLKGIGNDDEEDLPSYESGYVRHTVTAESSALASRTDSVLSSFLPKRLVSDPSYLFGTTEKGVNLLEESKSSSPRAQEAMKTLFSELMMNVGKHSRNFINSVLESVQLN